MALAGQKFEAGKVLRDFLDSQGISVMDITREIKGHYATIYNIVDGRVDNPRMATLEKIAGAINKELFLKGLKVVPVKEERGVAFEVRNIMDEIRDLAPEQLGLKYRPFGLIQLAGREKLRGDHNISREEIDWLAEVIAIPEIRDRLNAEQWVEVLLTFRRIGIITI